MKRLFNQIHNLQFSSPGQNVIDCSLLETSGDIRASWTISRWTTSRWTILLLSTLAIASCQQLPSEQIKEEKVILPKPADPRVTRYLAEAQVLLQENRLTTPIENNAYLKYLQVLAIDPANEAADQGIANIVEIYLSWAIENIDRGYYRRARDFLNKANSVDETHPNIPAVEKQLERYSKGGSKFYKLNRDTIKSSETRLQLRAIAREIASKQANILIEAPSDAIGRYIYQQLNNVTEDRIRARFELTSRIRISLYY